MMDSLLKDKRIFIAGGSSGIGLSVAKMAYKLGAKIIVGSRSAAEKHAFLVDEIGPGVESHSFDATSEAGAEKALATTGDIDYLVITLRPDINPAPFVKTTVSEAQKAFSSKFWGQYRLISHAAGHISPGGGIVMTSGIAGEKIYKNFTTMALINSASETLCKALAVELAPIRVNIVSPGFVAPKPPEAEKFAEAFPLGRFADPFDVAKAYIHLMENAYITGMTMVVDGGARLI